MKRKLLSIILLCGLSSMAYAEADPNFYIYLCFGQSNMEGNAQWENIDNQYVDPRFQMLATTNFSNPRRNQGQWYTATCPIVSPVGKLGPTDYFGRSMVAALPSNVKVGVVAVAMGGSPIEMFDKDKYKAKMDANPNEWWAQIARNYYGGNPYQRLIDMGKKAQEVGVIKGILLHQGCSNNGDPNWPNMVKKIYNDMLADLGLNAEDVPLFAGETLQQDQGGSCYAHNTVVNRLPQVIPTSHVIHSNGCPGNGQDPWHFNASGYRTMGKRYAIEALKVMGMEPKADPEYTLPNNLKVFYTATQLETYDIVMKTNGTSTLTLWGKFSDGHREDLTNEVVFTSDDFTVADGVVKAGKDEKEGVVKASYLDFTGTIHTVDINVVVSNHGTPYHGLKDIPGTIEAEDYDMGGEGLAFHDTDNTNEGDGASYRTDGGGVDIIKCNGGYAVGYTAVGEWLQYTVNVTKAGEYSYEAYVSSGTTGSSFNLGLPKSNGRIETLARISVPKTGDNDWNNYQVVSGNFLKPLQEGKQTLHLQFTGGSCNIDKIVLTCTSEDGIETVILNDPSESSHNLYNLAGQKVDANYKGIVVKNGRKMITK